MSEDLFKRAVALAKAGRKDDARSLFQYVIDQNPLNESAWLWYADTLPTPEERIEALEECLRLLPKSKAARQGIKLLRLKLVGGEGALPAPENRQPAGPADNAFPSGRGAPTPPFDDSITADLFTNPFTLDGSSSPPGSNVFTVSPDEVTNEDLERAERSLRESRFNPTDPLADTATGLPFRLQKERAGENRNGNPPDPDPTEPLAATQSSQPFISSPAEQNLSGWQMSFSDETSLHNSGGEVAESGEQALGEAQPESAASPAQTQKKKATPKKKTDPGDLVFMLFIAVVIVVILLVVVFVNIAHP